MYKDNIYDSPFIDKDELASSNIPERLHDRIMKRQGRTCLCGKVIHWALWALPHCFDCTATESIADRIAIEEGTSR